MRAEPDADPTLWAPESADDDHDGDAGDVESSLAREISRLTAAAARIHEVVTDAAIALAAGDDAAAIAVINTAGDRVAAGELLRDRAGSLQFSLNHLRLTREEPACVYDDLPIECEEATDDDVDEALQLAHQTQDQATALRATATDLDAAALRNALELQAPSSSTAPLAARRTAAAWLRDRAGALDREAEQHRQTAQRLARSAGRQLGEEELNPIPF